MKYLVYGGSTSDGKVYYSEYDTEKSETASGRTVIFDMGCQYERIPRTIGMKNEILH